MDTLQLDQELRSKKIRSCYLVLGPERHLALTAQQQIIKVTLGDSQEGPDRFQAGQTPLHTILDALKSHSLLTPWRVVMVEEVDNFKKKEWETIHAFLEKPLSKATLVLVAEGLKPADLKNLSKAVAIVECKKLYPRQVAFWINIQVKNLGLHISQEAARFLAECVGTDLGVLQQALEKLLLFLGERKLVELKDVEQVVSHTAQRSIFDLTNAIGEKNRYQALQCLDNVLDHGEEPLKAFALIARHFRLLAKAQEILVSGGGDVNFAKVLQVHPFFAKDYAAQSKKFEGRGWDRRFARLLACDRALKSSRLKPQLILEKLILDLCR